MTCFFLDTAKNVIDYVKVLSQIIKPGGLWINLGPLLYHWSDIPGEISIELSFEQLRAVILSCGFTFQVIQFSLHSFLRFLGRKTTSHNVYQ